GKLVRVAAPCHATATGDVLVEAYEGSTLTVDGDRVEARAKQGSTATINRGLLYADQGSTVIAHGGTVNACRGSTVTADGEAVVYAKQGSTIIAHGGTVYAHWGAQVTNHGATVYPWNGMR
ncbi:MAG: hypothetical protein H0X01_04730, partial [Nitrospira sp.]|nr:hypothetical protein [Nitrospira sp.]